MQKRTINEDIYNELMADNVNHPDSNGVIKTPINKIPTRKQNFTAGEKKSSNTKDKLVIDTTSESKSMFNSFISGNSIIFDAILGGIIMFIVGLDPINNILSKFISGYYTQNNEKILIPSGSQFTLLGQNTTVSFKGKLIQIVLFAILFIVVKNCFMIE